MKAAAEAPDFVFLGNEPSITSVGVLNLDTPDTQPQHILKVAVVPRTGKDGSWYGENYTLRVYTKSGIVITKDFYSAYGPFSLYVPIGFWPNSTIILITAEGKGTSVTKQTLTIYGVGKTSLQTLFTKTIADFFGDGEMWWYTPRFTDVVGQEGAITQQAIEIKLHHDPLTHRRGMENPKLIPSIGVACIYWNDGGFKEIDGKACSQVPLIINVSAQQDE